MGEEKMKKILYCNACALYMIEGHRYFDVKWANLLSKFADVTLLSPENNWYELSNSKVRCIVFDAAKYLNKKRIVNLEIWNKGALKHLNIRNREYARIIFEYILKLDRREKYDYIIFSQKDFIMFDILKRKMVNLNRIFWIDHSCSGWDKFKYYFFYKHSIHKVQHIVMERVAIKYLENQYGIELSRIHYIPHMTNTVLMVNDVNEKKYDIVGISNSNDDKEIYKIIELEKREHFFEKNNIKVILRSKSIEFDSKNLVVFAKRLGLTFEEYYGYILSSKIVLLPFGIEFGVRSSGTIMDALSNRKPIIGSAFPALSEYSSRMANICHTYENTNELKNKIKQLLTSNEKYDKEYDEFIREHSDEFILQQMKTTFI